MAGDVAPVGAPAVETTLAEIDRLLSSRAHRDERRALFLEGVRNLVHAVDQGWTIRTLVHSKRLLTSAPARQRVRALRARGVPAIQLSPEVFRRVSRAEHASGVGAIVEQRWQPLHALPPRGCWLVLERVRSPGNLGTLLRSSSAFGGAGLILLGPDIDPFDPTTVRASMGALFAQTLVRTRHDALRGWIARHRAMVVGAAPDAQVSFQRLRYREPTLLLLGNERKGLSPAQRALSNHQVRIPMNGTVDSLNLAIAGSMLLYEARRAK